MKAKRTIGYYISVVTTVLAAVSLFLYGGVLYRDSTVTGMLIAAIVVGVITLAVPFVVGGFELINILPAVSAVLLIVATVGGVGPMVREIAYVYAGLNPMVNIQGWLTYTIVAAVAWLLSVVATFGGIAKKQA